MNAEAFVSRLDGARSMGSSRWVARCPAHEDRRPSLSVRETDEGKVLLHCFAGCDSADVLAAVGLSLSDLFPEKLTHHGKPGKPNHWHAAREALQVLSVECLIVAVAAENVAQGIVLSDEDRSRLIQSACRIRAAAEACK